jgi:two-component system, NtrC family, sensor kinase
MAKKEEEFEMKEATGRDFAVGASRSSRAPILVVDDDHGVRALLSALLSMMGFQVTQAADGDAALELIARERFRAVLTDFQMPGMDGFTLASNIKGSSPGTPVIMLTGSDRSVVEEEMRKGCVDAVLFKPFKLEDFHETVASALTGGSASCSTGQHFGKAQRGEWDEKTQN